MTKHLLALATVAALMLGACGSDDSDGSATASTAAPSPSGATDATVAATASSAAPTTAAPTTSAAPATTTAVSTAGGSAPAAGSAATTAVVLKEWAVEAPATLQAGPQAFSITNSGSFPHEFAVFKGTYETLAKTSIGAIDEGALPAGTLISRTDRIDAGSGGSLSVDLPAGQYVLMCNISVGPNSHAGKGQRIDITVA